MYTSKAFTLLNNKVKTYIETGETIEEVSEKTFKKLKGTLLYFNIDEYGKPITPDWVSQIVYDTSWNQKNRLKRR